VKLLIQILIILIASGIAKLIHARVLWEYRKLNKAFKEEYPEQGGITKTLLGKIIPEKTPFKKNFFKSSESADEKLKILFSADFNKLANEDTKKKYGAILEKIHRLDSWNTWIVIITIILILLIQFLF